jgi:hypothetical protein
MNSWSGLLIHESCIIRLRHVHIGTLRSVPVPVPVSACALLGKIFVSIFPRLVLIGEPESYFRIRIASAGSSRVEVSLGNNGVYLDCIEGCVLVRYIDYYQDYMTYTYL